eukprot:9743197-Alexandrium_andersonii.AAC.1
MEALCASCSEEFQRIRNSQTQQATIAEGLKSEMLAPNRSCRASTIPSTSSCRTSAIGVALLRPGLRERSLRLRRALPSGVPRTTAYP